MAKFYRKTKSPTILTLSKAGAEFGPEALLDAIYVNYQATPDCSPSGDTKIVCEDAGAKEDLMMHLDALVGEFGIDGQSQNAPRQRTRAAKKLENEARRISKGKKKKKKKRRPREITDEELQVHRDSMEWSELYDIPKIIMHRLDPREMALAITVWEHFLYDDEWRKSSRQSVVKGGLSRVTFDEDFSELLRLFVGDLTTGNYFSVEKKYYEFMRATENPLPPTPLRALKLLIHAMYSVSDMKIYSARARESTMEKLREQRKRERRRRRR